MARSLYYRISRVLIDRSVPLILGSLLGMGGYFVAWNSADARWKTMIAERQEQLRARLGKLEQQIEAGQLVVAKQRLDKLEKEVEELQRARK